MKVKVFENREKMGRVAGTEIANYIKILQEQKDEINIIFAAAPSQNEVLQTLVESDVEWNCVNAFHMDEYIGFEKTAPQGFGNFLKAHIFEKLPFKSVNYIDCEAKDADAECERYAKLLETYPVDFIVMGIGENGHIAFNDPWEADFRDKKRVKVVRLDEVCRRQQVNDGCFESIEQVPKFAITLTCPVFEKAPRLFCVVPAATKAEAVYRTVKDEISEEVPATIMRDHKDATLYCDKDSASKLLMEGSVELCSE